MPPALVAVRAKVNVPSVLGVPERTPVCEFKDNPSGRVPLIAVTSAPLLTLSNAPLAANVQE